MCLNDDVVGTALITCDWNDSLIMQSYLKRIQAKASDDVFVAYVSQSCVVKGYA